MSQLVKKVVITLRVPEPGVYFLKHYPISHPAPEPVTPLGIAADTVTTIYGTWPISDLPQPIQDDLLGGVLRRDGWWDLRYSASKRAVEAHQKVTLMMEQSLHEKASGGAA